MKHETKLSIISALESFIAEHKMSQQDIAKKSGVNVAYISAMCNNKLATAAGKGKVIDIAPKWFIKVADYIGFSIEKTYWSVQSTDQMVSIVSVMEDALRFGYFNTIIGATGCGKTFISSLFARKYPQDIITVTVSNSDNLGDLLDKILEKLRLQPAKTKSKKLRDIVASLIKMKQEGRTPMIVFDECEFMKLPTLCMMKELYDALYAHCALVMLATPEFLTNLEKLRRRNKAGIPQFCRRIKFGIRRLPAIDRTFKGFLNGYNRQFQEFVRDICDNYGELHDVLVPAMREAERLGEPVTESLVRKVLGMQ